MTTINKQFGVQRYSNMCVLVLIFCQFSDFLQQFRERWPTIRLLHHHRRRKGDVIADEKKKRRKMSCISL